MRFNSKSLKSSSRLDKAKSLYYSYVMSGKVCAHIYRLFQHQHNYFPLYPENPQILDILILTI
ncbi:hypothetical protein ANA_C10781 [Anabaena sp. 90]|nr:hypothetical protein ANA_C10781 [Anabaena sp. 90]